MSSPQTTCLRIRGRLEEAISDERAVGVDEEVYAHLEACADCRGWHEDHLGLHRAIQEMPGVVFPDAMLQALPGMAETKEPARPARLALRRWFQPVAAAALFMLAVTLPWVAWRSDQARQLQVERAVTEAQYVLGVTAGALRRAENVAVEEVYAEHLSPVLQRLPATSITRPLKYFGIGTGE